MNMRKMRTTRKTRKAGAAICAILLAAILLSALLISCGSGGDVSTACSGYASGRKDEFSFSHREKTVYVLPAEFVRAYAVLCAKPDRDLAAHVVFEGDALWMRSLAGSFGAGPDELQAKMNAHARENGLSLTFGSLCGQKDREEDLYRLCGKAAPEFLESSGSLADMKRASELFFGDETLRSLLGVSAYTFADGSKASRKAPLVSAASQFHLDNAVMFLGGTAVKDGQIAYAAIAAVREGDDYAFAAVGEQSGNDDPAPFAATDAGNLCGQALGKSYGLAYSPPTGQDGAGMAVGGTIFSGVVIVFLIVIGSLFLLAAVAGFIMVVRRNREGRRKYSSGQNEENTK